MISEKKAANAMGGKTARACDGCLRKRARWYCAADDAFLCQGCDASVHSANQLASRHERVRLEVASSKLNGMADEKDTAPVWHQGFTRKARTPRPNKAMLLQQAKHEEKVVDSNEPIVPEIGSEEGSLDEGTEEQLLYQVPVFDPFAAELGCDMIGSEGNDHQAAVGKGEENMVADGYGQDGTCDLDDLHGFLPSDMDLAEFAADVESLLGGGAVDEESCDVKDLGLLDCKEESDHTDVCFSEQIAVKIKDEEVEGVAAIDWNFDYESPVIGEEEEEKAVIQVDTTMMNTECKSEMKKNVSLKLNYDAVITAWASQGCPWTTGSRPEFNPNHCWPDCMVTLLLFPYANT